MPSTQTPASGGGPERSVPEDRFAFRFDPRYVVPAALFGITPLTTWVRVTADELVVRFGPWSARTPLDNIVGTEQSGPYRLLTTMGPARGSFADGGATFATNRDAGLCIRFGEPQPILLPGRLLKSPGLTVTVADVDELDRAIARRNVRIL